MASTYSTNLAIELIGTGDQAGSWGNTTNTNLGTLIEQAISGYVTQAVATGTDTTITIPNGATGVARNMYIELTGTGGTNTNLIVPSNKKLYFIFNNSTGAVTVKVSGQTGVSVPTGKKVVLTSNGTDVVNGLNYIADFGSNSATITQLTATSATITNLTLTSLVISNLSIASANITTLTSSSATVTNLLATSLTVSSGSTLNGGVVINEPGADADTRIEGDTDANLVFVDASTDRVGVGTSTPGYKLDVRTASGTVYANVGRASKSTGQVAYQLSGGTSSTDWIMYMPTNSDNLTFFGNSADRMVLDTSGNLGLGVTPSAWISTVKAFQISDATILAAGGQGQPVLIFNGFVNSAGDFKYLTNNFASRYEQVSGQHQWYTAASGTAGNTITFTQAMTLDASGNLGVGVTDPATYSGVFVARAVSGANFSIRSLSGIGGTGTGIGFDALNNGAGGIVDFGIRGNTIQFFTTSERARITSAGEFLVGQTAGSINAAGAYITGGGQGGFCVSGNICVLINRKTNDGTLISFRQDDTEEGTISVSGNTVSYNAFAGSHWSQLQDGSKPDILRGTVMESINELCEWPDENNERLPKSKVSDTAGSKKVYGVFMAWDNDWTETNDMYVTAVGAFICRVNGSVTVQEGDLLESNGDGTARVQADDIIRSSTIGKVTSTVKTHEYDDGSYCVPTVLYCG